MTTTRERIAWMDAGRGLAILLVVLLHAEEWLTEIGWASPAWRAANEVLAGLRMPLFFTISGMLGAGWANRRWHDLLGTKVAFLLWAYLLWQPVDLAASALAYDFTGGSQPWWHWPAALAATVVMPRSTLWFLWALAAFFVLAKALAPLPPWHRLVWAATVAYLATCTIVPEVNAGWNGLAEYAVFFLAGGVLRDRLVRLAEGFRVRPGRVPVAVLTWIVLAAVVARTGMDVLPGPGLLVRVAGLVAGIALAAWLAELAPVRWLGSRTLQIYLPHNVLIILVVWGVHHVLARPTPLAWAWAPPVLAAVVVVATLGLRRLLGERPMYALPRIWVDRKLTTR